MFEGPVAIRDPDKLIGTFVFTALSDTGTPGRMRWNVVSMYKNATAIEPYAEAKLEFEKAPRSEAGGHHWSPKRAATAGHPARGARPYFRVAAARVFADHLR